MEPVHNFHRHMLESEQKKILSAAADFLWSTRFQQHSDDFVATNAPLFIGAVCRNPVFFSEAYLVDSNHSTLCAHVSIFQLGIHGEQRLEYQQLYLQYRAIYERALEQFCLRENIAFGTFVDACEAALVHSEWAEYAGFAECVLAMSTYEYFVQMMCTAAEAQGCAGPSSSSRASGKATSCHGGGVGEGLVDADDDFP